MNATLETRHTIGTLDGPIKRQPGAAIHVRFL